MNLSTHKKSEVDLRVAQELKNNQDFIYQTNQKLNSLSQGIVDLSLQNERVLNKFQSEKKAMEIMVENLRENLDKSICDINKSVDQFRLETAFNVKSCLDLLSQVSKGFVEEERFESFIKKVLDVQIEFQKSLDSFISQTESGMMQLKGHAESSVAGLRKEIDQKPSEVPALEEKMNVKLDEWSTNFAGITQEVAILKKASKYADKKFESIYTLIENLKDSHP